MLGIIILTGTSLILSIILVFASDIIDDDSKVKEYEDLLPNLNCGICGFNSCKGMAEAMIKDSLNYKKCRPLRGMGLNKMEAYLENDEK